MMDDGDDAGKRNWRLAVVLAMTLPGAAGSAAEVEPSDLIEYANEQGIALRAHVFAAEVGDPPHPAILFATSASRGGSPAKATGFSMPGVTPSILCWTRPCGFSCPKFGSDRDPVHYYSRCRIGQRSRSAASPADC